MVEATDFTSPTNINWSGHVGAVCATSANVAALRITSMKNRIMGYLRKRRVGGLYSGVGTGCSCTTGEGSTGTTDFRASSKKPAATSC